MAMLLLLVLGEEVRPKPVFPFVRLSTVLKAAEPGGNLAKQQRGPQESSWAKTTTDSKTGFGCTRKRSYQQMHGLRTATHSKAPSTWGRRRYQCRSEKELNCSGNKCSRWNTKSREESLLLGRQRYPMLWTTWRRSSGKSTKRQLQRQQKPRR